MGKLLMEIFLSKKKNKNKGERRMALAESITAIGSIMTAWTNVATEGIKLPVDIWSTIFNVVTG